MAVDLSVKNVPDDLAQKLRDRAHRSHRSLQGELLAILEAAVAPPPALTPKQLLERIRDLGLKTGDEATAMIREDRDAG